MASLGWGVACFVILYSYGEGFGFALRSSFQAVGQDLILMFGGETSAQAGGQRSGREIQLDLTDVDLIRDNVPLVSAVSAEVFMRGATVLRGVRQENMSVRGVEPAYGKVRNMTLAEGRWINGEDSLNKQRVAILGRESCPQALRRNSTGRRIDHDERYPVSDYRSAGNEDPDFQLQYAGQRVHLHSTDHGLTTEGHQTPRGYRLDAGQSPLPQRGSQECSCRSGSDA